MKTRKELGSQVIPAADVRVCADWFFFDHAVTPRRGILPARAAAASRFAFRIGS
ncbi:hypothetical protein [Nitratireductor sp. GCM10026969]